MGTTNTPQTPGQMARVGNRVIPAGNFPRKGAFCLVGGHLAIIVSLGQRGETVVDGAKRDFIDTSAPFAEVHLVQTDETHKNFGHFKRAWANFPSTSLIALAPIGEPQLDEDNPRKNGAELFNVPLDRIERAPWSIMGPILDKRNGPEAMPDLLYASRAGYILTAEEEAQLPALLEDEARAKEQQQFLATHPEAVALEESIEADRVAFIQAQGARRQELADKLLAARGQPAKGE